MNITISADSYTFDSTTQECSKSLQSYWITLATEAKSIFFRVRDNTVSNFMTGLAEVTTLAQGMGAVRNASGQGPAENRSLEV